MTTFLIKHYIKRRFQKINIWFKGLMDPDHHKNLKLDDTQKKAITICIRMIKDPDSELLMTTTSEKRYIKNGNYFVVINQEGIKIVNHVYGYDVRLYGRKFASIKKMFDQRLDQDRLVMEQEMIDNIEHSLDLVLENLKSKSK